MVGETIPHQRHRPCIRYVLGHVSTRFGHKPEKTIWRWCVRFGIAHHTTRRFRENTKGNAPHIHEEMPFGTVVLFDLGEDCEALTGGFRASGVTERTR